MIILDTNVLSEIQRPVPDSNVMAWLDVQEPGNLYVTAITAEELLFGAFILPDGDRKTRLVGAIEAMLEDDFGGRILPYDGTASLFYAMQVSRARERGVSIGVTSHVIIRPLPEQVRPLFLPVLERIDGRSALQH